MRVNRDKRVVGRWSLLVAMAALAVLAGGPAALAGGGSLAVTGHSVMGNVVHVSVHNSGSSTTTGTVVVTATLQSGMPASNGAAVSVAAGQTVMVAVGFGEAVSGVTQVGISDNKDPF